MKKTIFLFLLPFVFACSNEDYLGGQYVTDGAGVEISVTATAPEGMSWSAGQQIGISASYASFDATARNREYVSETGSNRFVQTTGDPIYVKGNTSIVAYFPYIGTDGAEPVITLFTADQAKVSDYYFAKADGVTISNGSLVNLVFHNALATLQFSINAPTGETIQSVRLSGFAQQAEVNPFTLDMKLSVAEDLLVTGSNLQTVTLRLIPQTVSTDADIPARMVLVGSIRSYTIDLGDITLGGGETRQATVDVTDGVGSIEFVPDGSPWTDSGLGGDISIK